MARGQRNGQRGERGAIAVLAAIVLLVIGAFLALSLNTGHKMNARAQLQGAADSGALAAARALDGTVAGLTAARTTGHAFVIEHYIDVSTVANDIDDDITPGFWDRNTSPPKFITTGQTATIGGVDIVLSLTRTPQYYNAVRVTAAADGTAGHNPPLDVWFGGFVGGAATMNERASAIAMTGSACRQVGTVLPMVVPSCAISAAADGGDTLCGQVVVLGVEGTTQREVSFTDLSQPSDLTEFNEITTQLGQGANGTSPQTETWVNPGDTNLSYANFTAAQLNALAGSFTGAPSLLCTTPPPNYPGCPRRLIPVVNRGGTTCGRVTGPTVTPVGFVRVVVTAVALGFPPMSISVFIDCSGFDLTAAQTATPRGGCMNFGLPLHRHPPDFKQVALVR